MNPIQPEKYPDSHPILRFLDRDGLMHTLGMKLDTTPRQYTDMNPTFLLRSLEYYRTLEDHRGDPCENKIITHHPEKRIPLSNTNLNPILVSCWSLFNQDDLSTETPWFVFKDTVAVIESTVGDVKQIIDYLAPGRNEKEVEHAGNWGSLRANLTEHGKIIYYSPSDHETIYSNFKAPSNCFYKTEPFSKEQEYRFIMMFGIHSHFAPEMFSARLKQTDFIKQIYLKKTHGFSEQALAHIRAYYPCILL